MSRYRKIDPRIWSDEQFLACDHREKLVWLCLLTHPMMTPMGAGILPSALIDQVVLDNDVRSYRSAHGESPSERKADDFAEGILERFAERSMVIRDNHLLIIRNFLIYNRPDNPNQLAGWIAACEELPRSNAFSELHSHLLEKLNGAPKWLFDGLLKPLSIQQNRGLAALFYERIGQKPEPPGGRAPKPRPKATGNVGANARQNHTQRTPAPDPVPDAAPGSAGGGTGEGRVPSAFDRFWAAYPRHEAKQRTREQFERMMPSEELLARILIDARTRYLGVEPDKVPHPSTYLNQRRWEDEDKPSQLALVKNPMHSRTETSMDIANRLLEEARENEMKVGNDNA